MPFLRTPELQPIKGIDFSVPASYLPPGKEFPVDLQYFRGEVRKRDGKTFLGGESLGAEKILHMDVFELAEAGLIYLIRHTKKTVQRYNTATSAWDDISGVALSGTETDFFSSATVVESDFYLFTNNLQNNVRKYIGSGNTLDLGGSPPKARYVEYVTPYVLLANLQDINGNSFPFKVAWSDTGLPEVWSGGSSGSILLSDDASAIRGVKKLSNYVIAYKEKSVYRGQKSGGTSIFDFILLSNGNGLYASRAVASTGDIHFYMGLHDFYMNDGVRINSIGNPVREQLFPRLNRTQNMTCHSVHVEKYKEVWFFVTVGNNSWPTEVWKFNYVLNFWYQDTVANAICSALYKQVSAIDWKDTPGTWAQQPSFWGDISGTANAPSVFLGFDTGFTQKVESLVSNDVGLPINATLETKDFTGIVHKGLEFDTRWLQVDVWAKGNTMMFWYSTDEGGTWTYVSTAQLSQTMDRITFWIDVYARKIRFRFQNNALNENITIRSFIPYYLSRTDRP